MKALSNVAVINIKDKENTWYLDIASAIYMTHNLNLYITPNLDYPRADIEIVDVTILRTQNASTIKLHFLVGNEYIQIKLSNVHYLSELDANLILFGVLEEKGYAFCVVNGFLQIKDKEDNIVLESIRENTVYPLRQTKLPARNRPYQMMIKEYKTSKPATKKKWHKRVRHVNNNNLANIPKMTTRISFLKDNKTEPEFCEAYILGKQHKMHSKEPPIDIISEFGIRLHADFFVGGYILPVVRDYQYKAILTDESIRMTFSMTVKLKDAICKEDKIIFNKIETYMGKKMQYF